MLSQQRNVLQKSIERNKINPNNQPPSSEEIKKRLVSLKLRMQEINKSL